MEQPRRTLSTPRKLGFAGLALLLFVGVAELGLRLVGAVYLQRYQAGVATGILEEGGDEFWAFGDSFTFGVGADHPSDESYPAVAVREASRLLGRPLALSNRARPGMNSTEVVYELQESLRLAGDRRPVGIVVLAGVNNERWLGQSGQFCLADDLRPGPQRWLAEHSRLYAALRWAVLRARPPRAADQACVEIAAGFDRLEAERPDEALAAFGRALELAPESGWAHLGAGLTRARTGDHIAAVDDFRRAAALGVESPSLGLVLGWSLRSVGEVEEAGRLAARAAEVEYLDDGAAMLQGWLAADEGDLETARKRFRVSGRLDARDGPPMGTATTPFALDGLAWLALRDGDVEAAAGYFEECRAQGDRAGVTPHRLGWCHLGDAVVRLREGNTGGVEELAQAASSDPSAAAAASAATGWARALEDGCEAGQRPWAAALTLDPDEPWAVAGVEACHEADPPDPVRWLVGLQSSPRLPATSWVDPGDTRLLRKDLLRAAELAREAGVPLYFMTYPNPNAQPELADATLLAGATAFVQVVDVRDAVAAELEAGASWPDMFVGDGHPTTRGYRLMGMALGAALAGDGPSP